MTTTAGGLEINSAYQSNILQAAQAFDTAYSSGKSTSLSTGAQNFSDALSQTAIDSNRSNDGKTNFAGLDTNSGKVVLGAETAVNGAKSAGNYDKVDEIAKLVISAFGNTAPPASTVPTATGTSPTTLTGGGGSGQLGTGPFGGTGATIGTNTGTPTGTPTSTQTTNPIGDNPGLNTTGTTGASSVDSQVAQGVAAEHAAATVGDKSNALGSVLSTMMAGLSSPAAPSPTTTSPTTTSPTTTSPTGTSPTTTGPVTGTNVPTASDPSMKVLQDGLSAINSLRSLADIGGGSSGKNNGVMGALDSLTDAAGAMFAARPQGGKPTDFAALAKQILPDLQNALAALAPGLSDTPQGRATMDQLANFLQELQSGISSQASGGPAQTNALTSTFNEPVAGKQADAAAQVLNADPNTHTNSLTDIFNAPVADKKGDAGQVLTNDPNSQTNSLSSIFNSRIASQTDQLKATFNAAMADPKTTPEQKGKLMAAFNAVMTGQQGVASAGQALTNAPNSPSGNSQTAALTAIYNQQMAAQYGLLAAIKNSQGA